MASVNEESSCATPQLKDAHTMHVEKPHESAHDETELEELAHVEHVKTFRKVDWRLMPMLMALYLISNLYR